MTSLFEFNFNFSPNIQQVKNQQYPNLFISVDFEIISKEMVKLFEKDNNILIETKFTKCIIGKNYIIINFPKDENINKYITIIGKLYDSIFKTEYILLYEHANERDEHIEKNKYNLNTILNYANHDNLFIPIIDKTINNNEEVICQILKYNYNPNNNNIIYKSINNNIGNNNGFILYKNMNRNKHNFNKDLKIVSNLNNINYLQKNDEKNLLINEINNLKNKLKNKINKNKKLSEEIELLKSNLKEMKNKYINIEKKADNLKIELENEVKKYKELEEKTNKELKHYNLIKKGSKDSLFNALLNKDKEIEELKLKLSRYPFELKDGEKLMTINFKSLDQKLECYSIICKESDLFCNVEKELYENNKDYYETVNYFTVNGNKIMNLKSLKENGIKNNDIIILNFLDI